MIDPFRNTASLYGTVGHSGDNERAERANGNEAAEMKKTTPLPDYQGNTIDVEA